MAGQDVLPEIDVQRALQLGAGLPQVGEFRRLAGGQQFDGLRSLPLEAVEDRLDFGAWHGTAPRRVRLRPRGPGLWGSAIGAAPT